jgi:hypothetical protein
MRWHVLRTLLLKEALRHADNRGGIALLLLLVAASMLLSFFGSAGGSPAGLAPGVRCCYVDSWENSPLVAHLRAHVPAGLAGRVHFRAAAEIETDARGTILYPPATGAVQVYTHGGTVYAVRFWYPGADGSALAPYEVWFWEEAYRFAREGGGVGSPGAAGLPPIGCEYLELKGGLDPRAGLAAALVLFGVFFVCVYLLPSLTCEERERGVLLAQALSPASAWEILAAKFVFYPAVALTLAALLAGTYRPAVLALPFFWLALGAAVLGSTGIGLTIASLARTQRAAGMGAMAYTLAVALVLFVCQQAAVPGLPHLALEYHCPRMLHAALTDDVLGGHWVHLGAALALGGAWAGLAAVLFRRRGWQ